MGHCLKPFSKVFKIMSRFFHIRTMPCPPSLNSLEVLPWPTWWCHYKEPINPWGDGNRAINSIIHFSNVSNGGIGCKGSWTIDLFLNIKHITSITIFHNIFLKCWIIPTLQYFHYNKFFPKWSPQAPSWNSKRIIGTSFP